MLYGRTGAEKIKSEMFVIGVYQGIGGLIGVIIIFYSVLWTMSFTTLNMALLFAAFLLFIYSILSGTVCLKGTESALQYSLINQVLQLIGFAVLGYAFSYKAGLYLTIGLNFTQSFNLNLGLGITQFDFNINNDAERTEMSFNLIAFALIFWIDKLKKKIKTYEEINTLASMGTSD